MSKTKDEISEDPARRIHTAKFAVTLVTSFRTLAAPRLTFATTTSNLEDRVRRTSSIPLHCDELICTRNFGLHFGYVFN